MKNIVLGESHTEVGSRIIILKWGKLQCGQILRISVKTEYFWDFPTSTAHTLSLYHSVSLSIFVILFFAPAEIILFEDVHLLAVLATLS